MAGRVEGCRGAVLVRTAGDCGGRVIQTGDGLRSACGVFVLHSLLTHKIGATLSVEFKEDCSSFNLKKRLKDVTIGYL